MKFPGFGFFTSVRSILILVIVLNKMTEQNLEVSKVNNCSWGSGWFNWTSTSSAMLRAVEKKILSFLKTPYRGFYVDIGPAVGNADKIWTLSLNTESQNVPLVLLHGLGAGVGLWVLNLDSLAVHRPVYAIDVLGFGRSSRPTFDKDALIAEKQLVKSIEEWRREMNINKMILLGHSMGGFLAASYAMSYPERINHLILADPWGFPEKPTEQNKQIPMWVRAIAFVVTPLNPFWAVRAAGPLGQWVVEKTRPDIMRKFSAVIDDDKLIPQYIHQCNAQSPSGESAFHAMMEGFGWAKNPMVKRIHELRADIPISLFYGSRSWVDSTGGEKIKQARQNNSVNLKVITGAGHHVYADKADIFNKYVNDACFEGDVTRDQEQNEANIQLKGEATESDQEIETITNEEPQNRNN